MKQEYIELTFYVKKKSMYEKIKLTTTVSGQKVFTDVLPTDSTLPELLTGGWKTVNDEVLLLRLQKKWFDMIAKGVKKIEYRDLSEYWATRLLPRDKCAQVLQDWTPAPKTDLVAFHGTKKPWKYVLFVNGYANYSPAVLTSFLALAATNVSIQGWGGQPGKPYFALHLGSVLSYSNLNPELEYEVYNNIRNQTT